jgi:homoprotocatechuate degradation regulator HpaR
MDIETIETVAESGGGALKPARTRTRLRSFSRSLPMSLLRAREAVMAHFRASLREFGITEQQWRVLRALTTVDDIEILALAEVTFLLPPSLSRILKELERRRLVTRRAPREDLRRGLISITDKGHTLIAGAGTYSEQIYAEITRRYGADKLALLQEMLRELETALAPPIEIERPAPVARDGKTRPRGRPPKADK